MSGDKNFRVYGDNEEPIRVNGERIETPDSSYSDGLKLSHATNVSVQECYIIGGKEDAIDMNRGCSGILIDRCSLESRGKYVVTIKDSESVTVSDCIVIDHGSETDIDLGNWSDTSTHRTKNISLRNVYSLDGNPVRVRVGNADWPTIIGGNCKIDYVGSYMLKAYWWGKFIWTKLTKK